MEIRNVVSAVGLVLTVLGGHPIANAAPALSSGAIVYEIDSDFNVIPVTAICSSSSSTGAEVNCQGTYGFLNADLNYTAKSSAQYGTLTAFGGSSVVRPGAGGTGTAYGVVTEASSSFRDQWTISGQPDGTVGVLSLIFDITGSYFFGDVSTGVSTTFSLIGFNPFQFSSDHPAVSFSPTVQLIDNQAILTANFTFGSALDFQINLGAGSRLFDLIENAYDGQSSFMDLFNTAEMRGIRVTSQSNEVVAFSLTTASNAELFDQLALAAQPSPTGVPEPTSVALIAAALLGLCVTKRRSVSSGK